eukprot:TRINITY_DN16366_c0_g2_i1.p1 TRINITY_DN16366_c0_g2~~TRINITY_DN16366_c0_g2_i1.p1  ORF type:complete len:386 (-),score=52.90 TRINITY_DN16366_c0_g2_i1:54-1172(-)
MHFPRHSLFQVSLPCWLLIAKLLDFKVTQGSRTVLKQEEAKKLSENLEKFCTENEGEETYDPTRYKSHVFAGNGSYAWVNRAINTSQNGDVVIKTAKFENAADLRGSQEEFCEECELLRWLRPRYLDGWVPRHGPDHIVKCLVNAAKRKPPVIVLEDAGQTSIDYLQSLSGEARLQWSIKIVVEASRVVRYLASNRVMHRDLKPHNIMVTSALKVKLIDFGMAVRAPSEMPLLSVTDTVLQSNYWANYRYAPPELRIYWRTPHKGGPTSQLQKMRMRNNMQEMWMNNLAAFDLWSLGITLIDFLCLGSGFKVDGIVDSIIADYEIAAKTKAQFLFGSLQIEGCLKKNFFGVSNSEIEAASQILHKLLSRQYP